MATKAEVKTTSSPSQLTSSQIRKVVIMVIISGSFAVTFLLGQVLGYTFAIRWFNHYTSLNEMRSLFICYRLYFINYSFNAIVHFALDRTFRKEVMALLRCSNK